MIGLTWSGERQENGLTAAGASHMEMDFNLLWGRFSHGHTICCNVTVCHGMFQSRITWWSPEHQMGKETTFSTRFLWRIFVAWVGSIPPLGERPSLPPGGSGDGADHGATLHNAHHTPPSRPLEESTGPKLGQSASLSEEEFES